MLRDWKIIHKEEEASRLELLAEALERRESELTSPGTWAEEVVLIYFA
jgi:hypothetical protein